jgi:endonuclease/exonuclease/phosphatase family metal-dependent hydrolase
MSLPPQLPRPFALTAALLLGALAALGCYRAASNNGAPSESAAEAAGAAAEGAPGDYLFCFWNTENFFDDKVDGWKTHPDKEFDTWFASDGGKVFRLKLEHLTEVLASLNDGKGPDILALAEVETERAAELLMESLNRAVGRKAAPYRHLLWKNPHGGRNISTAILTRLPVEKDRTQLLGKRQRILEGHVRVNGHDLVVIASHWTSRLREEGVGGRDHYADAIYGRFRAMYKSNPNVDVVICGDFNDNPDDDSVVKHLHATGDLALVRKGGEEPHLYNLFAKRWERDRNEVGTHYHRGKWFIFDQIVISPGMLKRPGWSWDEKYPAQIVRKMADEKTGRPLSFGNEKDKKRRGASDHFPVTVRLHVAGAR